MDSGASTDEPAAPDLLREVLAGAQSMARTRRPGAAQPRRRTAPPSGARAGKSGYTGPGPDESDPALVGDVLASYVADEGWERPLAAARVFADWATLVGPDIAAHCRPTTLVSGELKVEAESTAWATQLRLMSSAVLARLVAELGPDVVTKLHFSGPVGPSWKHGGFSVRGARGPRDTYG